MFVLQGLISATAKTTFEIKQRIVCYKYDKEKPLHGHSIFVTFPTCPGKRKRYRTSVV